MLHLHGDEDHPVDLVVTRRLRDRLARKKLARLERAIGRKLEDREPVLELEALRNEIIADHDEAFFNVGYEHGLADSLARARRGSLRLSSEVQQFVTETRERMVQLRLRGRPRSACSSASGRWHGARPGRRSRAGQRRDLAARVTPSGRGPTMSGREVTARVALSRDQGACTPADLDAVRFEVARADVMAQVAQEHFDRTNWREVDEARVGFVAHLVAATAEAASAALLALDDLRRAVGSRSAVPPGEIWSDG